MKKIGLIIAMIVVGFGANSQINFLKDKPISVGYYGHFIFHPGLKIGTQFDLKEWDKRKERKKGTIVKTKNLFISPQIGFYTHPKNHAGLLFNADFGYQKRKDKRSFYQAYSIGLGYITQFNAGTTYISQEDGSITEKKWTSRGYIMSTFNVELGQEVNSNLMWFSKFSLGSKLFYNTAISAELFLELGIKFKLNNQK